MYAVEAVHELTSSANMPLVIRALDTETGVMGDYVVKLNASERMHRQARLRELVAAFMAMELGIPVVIPAVIDISQGFVETLRGKEYYGKGSRSLGYNVGSEYVKNLPTLDNHIALSDAQKRIAQHIFAFDVLIENADRNFLKPNMLTDGNTLIMLDHELAFSFTMTLRFLRNPTPWNIVEADLKWIEKHCLHGRLKGCVDGLTDFRDKIVNLDADFWHKVSQLIPAEWFDEELFTEIRNHCDGLVAHRDEFTNSVKQLLA